eukprot:2184713-Prymnesium_polylepis.3
MRRVDPRRAARALLVVLGVRRRIAPQEEPIATRAHRVEQREPVLLRLKDWQAVVMRADAAGKERVAVDEEVVRRDGAGDVGPRVEHCPGRLLGRQVLEHHLEA